MNTMFQTLIAALAAMVKSRHNLVLENIALRHQVAVLQRKQTRPRLRTVDRAFWMLMSRFWLGWKDALAIVKPETVVGWHRAGFRLFWRWKSRTAAYQQGLARFVGRQARVDGGWAGLPQSAAA